MTNENALKVKVVSAFANKVLAVLNAKGEITTAEFLTIYVDFQESQGATIVDADADNAEEEEVEVEE